jgi:hypothetical protein
VAVVTVPGKWSFNWHQEIMKSVPSGDPENTDHLSKNVLRKMTFNGRVINGISRKILTGLEQTTPLEGL